MTFTDDDLAWFEYHFGHLSHCAALLARLEAAEKMVNMNPDTFDYDFAYKEWRKASGKDK